MDRTGCTNTGISSNEISDNVYGELCGFQNPNLIDNSDKTLEPYVGVDYDSTPTITMKVKLELQMTVINMCNPVKVIVRLILSK